MLFSLLSFLERHKDQNSQSCTDVECIWDKPRKISLPMEVDEINITHDQSADRPMEPTPTNYTPVPAAAATHRNIEVELYNLVSEHKPKSLLMLTLDPPVNLGLESSTTDDVVVMTMHEAVASCSSGVEMVTHLKNVFNSDMIEEIETITRGQCENNEWFTHRQGRITASLFSSVMHFKFRDAPENYILKLVMGKGNNYRVPSLAFGREHEPIARQQYFQRGKKVHRGFKVKTCGLIIDSDHPYIGASPDGLVSCSCCGNGTIEIKCSYTYQNETPDTACADDHYHVFKDANGDIKLKHSSSWYLQIQGQMGVCKLKYCDFILYTRKGIAVDRVHFDPQVYDEIVTKCKKFFELYVLNKLRVA